VNVGGMPKGKDPKEAGSHHTPDFFVEESGMKTGIKALCYLVLDYMAQSKGTPSSQKNKKSF
jgi:amidohydrolase